MMACKLKLVRPNSLGPCPAGTYTLVVDGGALFERFINTLWVMGVGPDRLLEANRSLLPVDCLNPAADAVTVLRRCWPSIRRLGYLCISAGCLTTRI